jgi:N-methylhydantoinase A
MPVLGVDTGGTFTDFYLIADDGAVSVYKRPSTPDDPARAILEGLAELTGEAARPGLSPAFGGKDGADLVHGSTVATNAIIERKGARTALITTRGFRDVLAIGRQTRPKLYDLSPQREPPLVPDDLRLEANERLDHRGDVLQAIDPAEVETLLDYVQQNEVESLAVCFLFSFLNQDHERLVAEAARKRGIPTSASYEVLPEHREYERTSTTVANAYVAPVMERYLSNLEKGAGKHGVKRLRVMSSNGGSVSPASAGRLAIRTALSGPAGGVAGAFALAQRAGFDRIVTLDMGGTSTDVALCPGRILERDETLVGELPIRGPTVDVLSVGAGGGSIARLDEGGALRVGPESAGADPGPACYGRGDQPTVTDAHVVLGRIAPEQFLGGRMSIDPELSFAALARIAAPFGGDAHGAAAAVLRVANANMERALRIVSIERGHDPRDFMLVAFGGAGPLHACDLAAVLRIPRVLIPPHPGVLSALGMATAPIVKNLSAAVMLTVEGDSGVGARHSEGGIVRDVSRISESAAGSDRVPSASPLRALAAMLDELERRGRKELKAEGFSLAGLAVDTFLEMRYAGQSYELSVRPESLAADVFLPAFHSAHHERYGHSDATRPVEIVTMRVKLVLPAMEMRNGKGEMRASKRGREETAGGTPRRREVWFGGEAAPTPVYERSQLEPGAGLAGPAVVVQMDSTTAVPPGWRGEVDGSGNLVVEPS